MYRCTEPWWKLSQEAAWQKPVDEATSTTDHGTTLKMSDAVG
jgi:hypothetical protein